MVNSQEILKFCIEKGLLLDKDVLNLLSQELDIESAKIILEKIKSFTGKNIITKHIFEANKQQVQEFILKLPENEQRNLENFKIKLGLSIEISKETTSNNISSAEIIRKFDLVDQVNQEACVKFTNNYPIFNKKLEVGDFVQYFRGRFNEMKGFLQEKSELNGLVSINKIGNVRTNVSIIGIVSDKRLTKNQNVILQIEDLTGKINVLINKDKKELAEKLEDVALDCVLGFKCSGNREILFANDIVFPEVILSERKRSPVEEYALFIGDLHFGSKRFLKDGFLKFIDYLNGKFSEDKEYLKIKYLFLVGDVITGVGNYPNQEFDLEIVNIENQFIALAELLGKIRKDIKIIISPGNHDGVRVMEPQPVLDEKYAWAIYELENVIVTPNPSYINIGCKNGFSGWDVLTYHGFSFPYFAGTISHLIKKRAMNCPEEIMKFLLKHRHLAPTHGSTQYYPAGDDGLIIKKIPDIFVSAHTHKCGVSTFNNILVISTSCWEAMTPYQEKFGNIPDHCKVPMVNLKTRAVKILDFEDKKEDVVEEKKEVALEVKQEVAAK